MMSKIELVKNPRENADSPASYDCDLFNATQMEYISFTAHQADPEQWGREIHAGIQAGDYGQIQPFVADDTSGDGGGATNE